MRENLAELNVLDGVLLLTGSPAVGKTTLARALADCLAATHVCVGDQLRLLRGSDRWTVADEQAYAGHCEFPLSTVVEALTRGLSAASGPSLVIDGSVGLREAVLQVVGRAPITELQLQLDDETARKRLAQRVASGDRPDEVYALARHRAAVWRSYIQARPSPAWPVMTLDASGSRQELVGHALNLLLVMSNDETDIPLQTFDLPTADTLGRHLAGLADRTRSTGQPHRARMPPLGTGSSEKASVLVIKPGLGQTPQTFERFGDWMHERGYRVAAATAWPLTTPGMVRRIAAHHGPHYVNSRWGDHTVAPITGETRRVVGYLQTIQGRRRSEWRSDATTRRRVQRGSCLWVDLEGDDAVVNSHVPGVIEGWFSDPNDVLIAMVAMSEGAALHERRSVDVGPSDPAHAPVGSLRGSAYARRIPFDLALTHQNNGFHVSDSAAAVDLERRVWFSAL